MIRVYAKLSFLRRTVPDSALDVNSEGRFASDAALLSVYFFGLILPSLGLNIIFAIS